MNSQLLVAFFACDEVMALRMGERGGAPGLDENRDTFWVRVEPHEGFMFHPYKHQATAYAVDSGLDYVYEARFDRETAIGALNSALENNVDSLSFMAKPLLKISDLQTASQ